jgi:hypothetical protein
MAGLRTVHTSGLIAMPAASTHTVVMQVKAPTNHRLKVSGVHFSPQGVQSGDTPIYIALTRSAAGTTPTLVNGSIVKKNHGDPETPLATLYDTFATPPSAGTVEREFTVHPQAPWAEYFPPGEELWVNGGDYLAVEVTPGASLTGPPKYVINLDIEE